ncbi:MAG TPA: glycosyltransferase family 39 protein [Verrucomicrobiae bacterium]|nr:glycosyltransferase family 39 protein [Verrucomicrobiae bacterium]
MKTAPPPDRKMVFTLALAFAFLCGLWLRCHLLVDQVFTDDEWHGLYYVIGKSPAFLLTHFSIPGATCIPLNFYTWVLGDTVGWSELTLRLPSLICGVLCVVAGPLLARELVGPRRAMWLGLLLAVSPLLIFYSRICRPYSAVALSGFVALLFAARWLRSGGLRPALLFAVAGVVAVYFHLFAAVTVAAPMLAALVLLIWSRWRGVARTVADGPSFKEWLIASLVIAAGVAVLVLPAFIHSLRSTFFNIALTGQLTVKTVPRMAQLISGTSQPVLAVLFWLALVWGAVDLCRRHPRFGWMLVSLYPLHALALVASRPDSAQSAIVLTRYCIPLVPVSLLLVACGLQSVLEAIASRVTLQPSLQTVMAVAGIGTLAATGPLPQCYLAPNNFTNHGAYQHHYGKIDWNHSFISDLTPAGVTLVTWVRADEMSPFYQWLADHPGQRPIVEYPMMIGDHFNPLYYYQYFHRRPVLVGYAMDVSLAQGLAAGNIYGNTYIDQVLSLVDRPSKLRFRNLISMDDLAAMRARGVEFVILHKRFEAQLSAVAMPLPDLEWLKDLYQKTLGKPSYEDDRVAVFQL